MVDSATAAAELMEIEMDDTVEVDGVTRELVIDRLLARVTCIVYDILL